MTFNDPVVAGDELIREAIRSADYSPGTSGWRIAADGDAEFNDVTVRGSVHVTDPATQTSVDIYTDVVSGDGAVAEFQPPPVSGHSVQPASIKSGTWLDTPTTIMRGSTIDDGAYAFLMLTGPSPTDPHTAVQVESHRAFLTTNEPTGEPAYSNSVSLTESGMELMSTEGVRVQGTLTVAGPVRSEDTSLPAQSATGTTRGTTTSTTYTASLTGVSSTLTLSFVAQHPSHCVQVSAVMTQDTSGPWNQFMAPRVTGPGFTWEPSDSHAAVGQATVGNAGCMASSTVVVTGLTVGETYTVEARYRCTNSSAAAGFNYRKITVW